MLSRRGANLAPSCEQASYSCSLLCYASRMAKSPIELILEVRYAWHH